MTQPSQPQASPPQAEATGPSPLAPGQPSPQYSAIDELSQLAAGNNHLITNPGLLTALQSGKATPEQAQTINSFNAGLDAQRRVRIAQAAGTKIVLSPQDQTLLTAMGQGYNDVLFSAQDAMAEETAGLAKLGAKPSFDAAGNITGLTAVQQPQQKSAGWTSSWGAFAHHLTHNVATDALTKAWNVVDTTASTARSYDTGPQNYHVGGVVSDDQKAQMVAQGYDPSNPFSVVAYAAAGKAHSNTSDLAGKWDASNPGLFGWTGDQAVIEAMKFNADPKQYLKDVFDDPNLTADQKVQRTQSQAFGELAQQVAGRQSSVGNDYARGFGLDPVRNPKAFALTSAGIDVAASFLIDPTILAGKGVGLVRRASIGLDDLSDGTKIAKVMDQSSKNPFHLSVQRGWQSLLDDGKQIREGLAAGTDEGKIQAAAAYAHARATTPHIVDMLPDVNGTSQLLDKTGTLTGVGKPLETLDDVSEYLQSKNALLRLTRGKAAIETALMPGSLSPVAFRMLKGNVASGLAGRSLRASLKRDASNIIPHEDTAVDAITGLPKFTTDVADATTPATGLASAQRAATQVAAAKGDALLSLRSGIGPQAIAARVRLLGQRMANFLPRNNTINLGDADAAEKVYRFGQQYLTKGDSALYAAMFTNGDEGIQKAVLDGIVEQTAHAAGLGRTETGRDMIDRLKDVASEHQYGHTGNETIVDPVSGNVRDVALFPSQVRTQYHLPSFKSLNDAAAKVGLYENTVGRALNSPFADTLMGYFRMAMLMKPNIATRNIVEGQSHVAMRGRYLEMVRTKAALGDSGALTSRKALMQGIIDRTGLDRVQRTYHALLKRGMTDEELGYLNGFDPEEFRATVEGFGEQIPGASPDPTGFENVDRITRSGFRVQRMQRTGYGMTDTTGLAGADRYVHALGTRFGHYPELDRALVQAAANPEHGVEDVIAALKSPALQPVVQKMIRAGTYEDPATGITRVARTEAERDDAIRKMAELQVSDTRYLLTDQAGNHIKPIADQIVAGKIPSAKWVESNLAEKARPKAVLAPQFRAAVPGGAQGMAQAILDSTGAGYKALVDDPIKRTTTDPVFMMNYIAHRKVLAGVQRDIEAAGIEPAAANKIVHDLAIKRAYNTTEAMIDDPGLKTQADVVGRGLFMFPRAMQAFTRRWGGLLLEDPTKFRKLFLAMEGMQHAGLTYTDSNGQKAFMYPGSDLVMGAFTHLANLIPGLGHGAMFPVSGGVGGQLNMVAPGVENPARFSMSPMLNMPMHLVAKLFPAHQQAFDAVDRALNGQDSQGKSWWSEAVPGAVAKFTAASNDDPRNSAMASAMVGAVANLTAADPDGSKGIWLKPDATASEIDSFFTRLQTQVKNQLYLRAAFGEFAPAPPGIPDEANGATKADPLYRAMGIKNLSDEYKFLLNEFNGDRSQATLAFVGQHPERQIYTVPGSVSTTNKAYLPSTTKAESFIDGNLGFMDKYKAVAAYFVPQDPGAFDLHAYRAQLEIGLREKRSPAEIYQNFRVTQAENEYYAAMDKRDAAIDQALSVGNTKQAANIRAGFTRWSADFYVANPLFKQKMDQYNGPLQDAANNAVVELSKLVADPNPPSAIRGSLPGLKLMVDAWHAHSAYLSDHKGTTTQDVATRAGEAASFRSYMLNQAQQDPNLVNIYNGVFRILDSKLTYATAPTSGG